MTEAAVRAMLNSEMAPVRLASSERDGRGVFASGNIERGSFVCEYVGVVLDQDEMNRREDAYEWRSWGSYMLAFMHDGSWHAIDATAERPEYGLARYINHSRTRPNIRLVAVDVGGVPRVAMIAKANIEAGDELLFDYGDRGKGVLANNQWLLE